MVSGSSFYQDKKVILRKGLSPKLLCMLLRFIVIFILSACCNRCFTQSFDEKDFIRYTKSDGISNNYVTGIVQDSLGYIWIGTNKGMNRFDGASFVNYFANTNNSPLPENTIQFLRLLSGNEILGGTFGGAFYFNTTTHQHKKFTVPADSVIFFWRNQEFDGVRDAKGNYVISTKTGLYVFNEAGRVLSQYNHYSPADAGRIEIWFGSWLELLSSGVILQKNIFKGSAYSPADNRIDTFFLQKTKNLNASLFDREDTMKTFFAGKNDLLFIVNGNRDSINVFDLKTQISTFSPIPVSVLSDIDHLSGLFYLSDSVLAITSAVDGFYLFHYDAASKKIACNGKKYFASKFCTSLLADKDGRLWVGTTDGLYKQNLRNSFFNTEDLSEQMPGIINTGIQSIYSEKDKLFIGLRNEGGLLFWDKRTKKIIRRLGFEKLGKGSSSINYIFPYHPDTLWLGTNKGIIWLNKKHLTCGRLLNIRGEPGWMNEDRGRSFLEDSRGNIWLSFGRLNSVLIFNRHEYKFTQVESPLLKITFCFSMCEDKQGNIWLAGDGLCRWNVKKNMIDTLIPFPSVKQIPHRFMQIFDVDENNNLWLSSLQNEIIEYNLSQNQMQLRLAESNTIDGYTLTNSELIAGHIWIGRLSGISAFNIHDFSIRQFNYEDGLPSEVVTSIRKGSFYDARENLFYFGATQYLISFTPDVSLSHVLQPRLFTEFTGNDDKILPLSSNEIRLSYSQNNLLVRFNVINFTDPEENRFAYRVITKEDSNWQYLNKQSGVALHGLAPGKYRIQVKLFSLSNRWPEQVNEMDILIRPPFWKTKWFISLFFAAALFVIYLFYRLRIKKIRKKVNIDRQITEFEMKALHAQMNPHFIFNCLNSIREMILNNENREASHYLSKFAQLIRITLNNSSKAFVSLENNIDYLRRYIEMEKIRNHRFICTFEVDDQLDPKDIMMPPMLIQPFIENAIWHGGTHDKILEIFVRFLKQDTQLVSIIEDNGMGIDASVKNKKEDHPGHNPFGIANVKERIQVLNEKYNLHSYITITDKSGLNEGKGNGTIVKLYFPLNYS
jgi:hypothetical protein